MYKNEVNVNLDVCFFAFPVERRRRRRLCLGSTLRLLNKVDVKEVVDEEEESVVES
jgi:hypothetical protein